jgi:hypothetical protein
MLSIAVSWSMNILKALGSCLNDYTTSCGESLCLMTVAIDELFRPNLNPFLAVVSIATSICFDELRMCYESPYRNFDEV